MGLVGGAWLAGWLGHHRATTRSRWLPVGLLGAALAAGVLSGRAAGAAARGSCLGHVEPGEEVELRGRLGGRIAGRVHRESIDRSARFVVHDPILRTSRGSCRLAEVAVRAPRPPFDLPTGAPIRLDGRWRTYARPTAWPRRPERVGFVRGSLAPKEMERGAVPPSAWPERLGLLPAIRAAAIDRVERRLPPDVAPAAIALLLAERSRLDAPTTRMFADAGLAHLLAISGLHVGVLAAVALVVGGLFFVGPPRFLAAAGLVVGYVCLIGAPPAATRAAVLFAGYAFCRARGSPARISELLGAAALVALVSDPMTLLDAGFQLSFAGCTGLLLGDGIARRAWATKPDRPSRAQRRARRAVRSSLRAIGASAGAFALTAPLVAWHFYRIAPVSVFSGLIGSPLVGLALISLLGVLLAPGTIAASFAASATLLIRALYQWAGAAAAVPFGHGSVGRPGAVELLVVGCVASVLVLLATRRPLRRAFPLLGLGIGLILASPAWQAWRANGSTLLCTLDVGQGDAAVVRTRRGHWLAVDAGPSFGAADAGRRVVLPFLLSNGARELELFALTHPDLDHIGGARSIFDRLPVRRVLDAGLPVPSERYRDYLNRVGQEGAVWLAATPGSRLRLDEVELLVLGPTASAGAHDLAGPARPIRANDASLSLRIRVDGRFTFVNAGDAPAAEEVRMVDLWSADGLRADALKVSHHGSKNSSSLRWLDAIGPELALISSGAGNRYGHPHPSVIERLETAGIGRVWRTDLEGTACIAVDPDGDWRLIGA